MQAFIVFDEGDPVAASLKSGLVIYGHIVTNSDPTSTTLLIKTEKTVRAVESKDTDFIFTPILQPRVLSAAGGYGRNPDFSPVSSSWTDAFNVRQPDPPPPKPTGKVPGSPPGPQYHPIGCADCGPNGGGIWK